MRRAAALLVSAALVAGAGVALAPAQAAPAKAGPMFRQYVTPAGMGDDAGEPSIGVDPKTGAIFYQASLWTLKATGLDASGAGSATWSDVSPFVGDFMTLDPILHTDQRTGRTYVSNLYAACGFMGWTDNDGASWTDQPLGCGLGAQFDHQTVGTGPFRPGALTKTGSYPDAVYYCAHDAVSENCSTSTDGGLTFAPARQVWFHAGDCVASSGHIKTGPDGYVYLPPKYCDSAPGLAVSDDNGVSWTMHNIDGGRNWTDGRGGDPSVAVGSDNTVYMGFVGKPDYLGSEMRVAMSRNHGASWSYLQSLGRDLGIKNVSFPSVVAGDGDRAAVTFLGTTTAGDDQVSSYKGVWRLYVSYTFDRGRTWKTYPASPIVQVGMICLAGTFGCPGSTRNLLDFQDATIDARGRVVVAQTVGCLKDKACTPNDRLKKATIVRQVTGKSLFRKFD